MNIFYFSILVFGVVNSILVSKSERNEITVTHDVSVNGNSFTSLSTTVQSHTQNISTIYNAITALEYGPIASNKNDIDAVLPMVAANTLSISDVQTEQALQNTAISGHDTLISGNTNAISSLQTGQVSQNTANIAGHDTLISGNTNSITALQTGQVSQNAADISTQSGLISGNTAAITALQTGPINTNEANIATHDTTLNLFDTVFSHTFDAIETVLSNKNDLVYGSYAVGYHYATWTLLKDWTYYGKLSKHVIITARTTVKCEAIGSLCNDQIANAYLYVNDRMLTYDNAIFHDYMRTHTLTLTFHYTLRYGDVLKFYVSTADATGTRIFLYHQPNFESYLSIASCDVFEMPFSLTEGSSLIRHNYNGAIVGGVILIEPASLLLGTYVSSGDEFVYVSCRVYVTCPASNCDGSAVYLFLKKDNVVIMTDYRYFPLSTSVFNVDMMLRLYEGEALTLETSVYQGAANTVHVHENGYSRMVVSSYNSLRNIVYNNFESVGAAPVQQITQAGIVLQNYEANIGYNAFYVFTAQSMFHNTGSQICEITMGFQIYNIATYTWDEETGYVIRSLGPSQIFETIETTIVKEFSQGDRVRVFARSSCQYTDSIWEYSSLPIFGSRFYGFKIPNSRYGY